MKRRAARVDANQPAIIAALRKCGVRVVSLAAIGNGCPDLLCGFRGEWHVLEVKDGSKPPSARKLTDLEETFINTCPAPVYVVKSVDEALKAIGAIR